jgi:hypothetical protein
MEWEGVLAQKRYGVIFGAMHHFVTSLPLGNVTDGTKTPFFGDRTELTQGWHIIGTIGTRLG